MRTRFHRLVVAVSAIAWGVSVSVSAQSVTYVGDIPLPSSRGNILQTTGTPDSTVAGHFLITNGALYPFDYPTLMYGGAISMTGVKTITTSLVAHTGTSEFFLTGQFFTLYSYNLATKVPAEWYPLDTVFLSATNNTLVARSPNDLVLVANNKIYSIDPTTSHGTVLVDTNGTAPGQISTAGSAAFGPDGLLYVLDQADGVNRIQSFDITPGLAESDRFRNSFDLVSSISSLAGGMAISATGRLYLADGLGGGSVYSLSGALLEDFSGAFTSGPDTIGGKSFLNLDRFGNIFVYTPGTSLHLYHDPAILELPATAQGHEYWKNNPSEWPVASLTLGGKTYSQTELLQLLKTPVGAGGKADASVMLAHQLIAAKLNIENGVVASATVLAAVGTADTLLSTNVGKLPYAVKPSTPAGKALIKAAGVLGAFNSGG